jgi:hypothetical protein
MSARHVLNPMQMQLFVDPEEHVQRIVGATDQRHDETREGLFHRKEMETRDPDPPYPGSHGAGLYKSVKESGVLHPIQLLPAMDKSGWIQFEGHHRIAAARAVQRDTGRQQWVPVHYNQTAYPSEAQLLEHRKAID